MRYKNTKELTGAPLGPAGPTSPGNPGNPCWPFRSTTKIESSDKKLTQNTTKWRTRIKSHEVIKKVLVQMLNLNFSLYSYTELSYFLSISAWRTTNSFHLFRGWEDIAFALKITIIYGHHNIIIYVCAFYFKWAVRLVKTS